MLCPIRRTMAASSVNVTRRELRRKPMAELLLATNSLDTVSANPTLSDATAISARMDTIILEAER